MQFKTFKISLIVIFLSTLFYFYNFYQTTTYIPLNIDEFFNDVKKNSELIVYPGFEIIHGGKKLLKKNIRMIRLMKEASYFDVSKLNNKKTVYFLSPTTPEKPINLNVFKKTKIKEKKDFSLFKLFLPKKTMFNNRFSVVVEREEKGKLFGSQKKGEKLFYGKKPWQYFGKRRLKIQDTMMDCLWIHPEKDFSLILKWENLKTKDVAIHFAMADSGSKDSSFIIKLSVWDKNNNKIDSLEEETSGKDLNKWKHFSFKVPEEISFLKVDIKAKKRAKNHLCIMAETF